MSYDLCPACNENPRGETHLCPFDLEVYKEEVECDCCDECTERCMREI